MIVLQKNHWLVIYLYSKLVCLFVLALCLSKQENTIFLQSLSISRELQIHNVLLYSPKSLFLPPILLLFQWKRISHKQSARWQQLSQLKASAFLILPKISCWETQQLIPGIGNAT